MSDYVSINSNSLRTDTEIGCDLYLLVNTGIDSRYILYCRGDAVFENAKKEMLVEKNINRLFIKNEDQRTYYEYLENNFQDVIFDTRISTDERSEIVHGAAVNLFNDPRAGNAKGLSLLLTTWLIIFLKRVELHTACLR